MPTGSSASTDGSPTRRRTCASSPCTRSSTPMRSNGSLASTIAGGRPWWRSSTTRSSPSPASIGSAKATTATRPRSRSWWRTSSRVGGSALDCCTSSHGTPGARHPAVRRRDAPAQPAHAHGVPPRRPPGRDEVRGRHRARRAGPRGRRVRCRPRSRKCGRDRPACARPPRGHAGSSPRRGPPTSSCRWRTVSRSRSSMRSRPGPLPAACAACGSTRCTHSTTGGTSTVATATRLRHVSYFLVARHPTPLPRRRPRPGSVPLQRGADAAARGSPEPARGRGRARPGPSRVRQPGHQRRLRRLVHRPGAVLRRGEPAHAPDVRSQRDPPVAGGGVVRGRPPPRGGADRRAPTTSTVASRRSWPSGSPTAPASRPASAPSRTRCWRALAGHRDLGIHTELLSDGVDRPGRAGRRDRRAQGPPSRARSSRRSPSAPGASTTSSTATPPSSCCRSTG